ncbi:uncharacterized protein EI90DRAFT_1404675 [Cantharellus anzutake]|uniref:uncharacterized protein n=1 Tax=Cantharellus anzutake TaxID=1750568 RepID=UPI001903C4E0|nr:uncharacterized protein EI90DRAFT_1404675 [Cantharellus anzutake]KAF8329495.1 hypothetical protein EI90DRAFT_1404675 [Cantharellus anzutake]
MHHPLLRKPLDTTPPSKLRNWCQPPVPHPMLLFLLWPHELNLTSYRTQQRLKCWTLLLNFLSLFHFSPPPNPRDPVQKRRLIHHDPAFLQCFSLQHLPLEREYSGCELVRTIRGIEELARMRKPGSSTPMRQVPGALLDVRRQIEDLGPDVRDLTTEQEHLGAALRLSHLTSPRPSLQDMESIWLLEEECIRLRAAALAAEEKAESAIAQAMELRAVIRSLEDQLQMASPLAGAGTEGSTDTSDYDTEGETLNPSEILSSVLYSDNASEATSYGEGGIARSAASTLSTSMLVADKRTQA